ncbi:hypothetical protein BDL97_07G043100 [Sphagnum fallax]|nr:hypothetical protein BDL97_07G043100 [Sphagnum fallax]
MISVTDCLGSHLAKHHHNREHFGFRATALTSWRQIPEDCYTQSNNQNETQFFHQATRLHQVRIAFKDKLKQHGTACSGRSPGVQKFSLLKGASLILTTDDLHKNTVLPAHVLDVGFNSEGLKLGFACCSYTKLSYGSSGIKRDTTVDEEKLSVDGRRPGLSSGESGNCSSRSIIPPLQTNILHEGRRHPRHHKHPPLGSENHQLHGPYQQSQFRGFHNNVDHKTTETHLISRLTLTLLRNLGIGIRWIINIIRLGLYAIFLMPGFIQGGAWIIGYKAWGTLLGQQLVERDIIVVCIDYRNFPQGCISNMVSDVTTGIGYAIQNVGSYGGDADRIFLAGQSAGAHLAACSLIMQAKKEYFDDPTNIVWRSSQLRGYLAISGGYNLVKLGEYFHQRGLSRSFFLSVMEGEESLPLFSPEMMVMDPSFRQAVPLLPPITLFHGTADYSIPYEASVTFGEALRSVGAKVTTVLYPDKTHTDLFLQDPMRGGEDKLLADILSIVHADDEESKAEDATAMMRRRLVPEILLQLARKVSPF